MLDSRVAAEGTNQKLGNERDFALQVVWKTLNMYKTVQYVLISLFFLQFASTFQTETSFETLTLSAGCFWSVELVFQRIPGVISTRVGYIGGKLPRPVYKQVAQGLTGHAEAVQLTFDSSRIPLSQLLDTFFEIHDPTTLNRQGNDRGSQYRSALFPANSLQKKIMEASLEKYKKGMCYQCAQIFENHKEYKFFVLSIIFQIYICNLYFTIAVFQRPIVTTIEPLARFWLAESYHQRYVCQCSQV